MDIQDQNSILKIMSDFGQCEKYKRC